MRRVSILLLFLLIALVLGGSGLAQNPQTDFFDVFANNVGLFNCAVNQASFDFGDVNADGVTSSAANVTPLGRTAGDDGGVYQNFAGTVTWSCRGAPRRAVDITMTSVAADHTSAGAPMADDDLEVQIPQLGTNGTSQGFQLFTSGADLYTGLGVGNGLAGTVNGSIDLRLTVLDVDPVGANTWRVNLSFLATP